MSNKKLNFFTIKIKKLKKNYLSKINIPPDWRRTRAKSTY